MFVTRKPLAKNTRTLRHRYFAICLVQITQPLVNHLKKTDNIEMAGSMWNEIFADASPMENDDQVNDDKSKFELDEEFDDELTMNSESEEQTFPIPSRPAPDTINPLNEDQPVCTNSNNDDVVGFVYIEVPFTRRSQCTFAVPDF